MKNRLGELSNSSSLRMTHDCFGELSNNSPRRVAHPTICLEGLPNRILSEKLVLCFQEEKPFVLKIVFLTLGLGMREGVSEGSRYGDWCITFSSITCRHLSRYLYVLLECLVCHYMST